MNCVCGGLIVHEWANPPFPAHWRCTNCRQVYTKAEMKVASRLQPEVKTMTEPAKKVCSVCKKEFPATNEYFSKNKSANDDLDYLCKACKSERQRALRLSRKDKNPGGHVLKKKNNDRRSKASKVRTASGGHKYQNTPIVKASPEEIVEALRKGVAREIIGDLKKVIEELEAKWN